MKKTEPLRVFIHPEATNASLAVVHKSGSWWLRHGLRHIGVCRPTLEEAVSGWNCIAQNAWEHGSPNVDLSGFSVPLEKVASADPETEIARWLFGDSENWQDRISRFWNRWPEAGRAGDWNIAEGIAELEEEEGEAEESENSGLRHLLGIAYSLLSATAVAVEDHETALRWLDEVREILEIPTPPPRRGRVAPHKKTLAESMEDPAAEKAREKAEEEARERVAAFVEFLRLF